MLDTLILIAICLASAAAGWVLVGLIEVGLGFVRGFFGWGLVVGLGASVGFAQTTFYIVNPSLEVTGGGRTFNDLYLELDSINDFAQYLATIQQGLYNPTYGNAIDQLGLQTVGLTAAHAELTAINSGVSVVDQDLQWLGNVILPAVGAGINAELQNGWNLLTQKTDQQILNDNAISATNSMYLGMIAAGIGTNNGLAFGVFAKEPGSMWANSGAWDTNSYLGRLLSAVETYSGTNFSLVTTNSDGEANVQSNSWAYKLLENSSNSSRPILRGPIISDTNHPSGKREMSADNTEENTGIDSTTVGQAQGEAGANALTTQFAIGGLSASVPAGSGAGMGAWLGGIYYDMDPLHAPGVATGAGVVRNVLAAFLFIGVGWWMVRDMIKMIEAVGAAGQLGAPDVQLAGFSVGKLLAPLYVAALLGGVAAVPVFALTALGGGSPFTAIENSWQTLSDFGGISNTAYGPHFWYLINAFLPMTTIFLVAGSAVGWLVFRGSSTSALVLLQKLLVR